MCGVDSPARVVLGDNLDVLRGLGDGSISLIYADPPFNTGRRQVLERIRVEQDANGSRTGFAGRRYTSRLVSSMSYSDAHDDYLGFLEPRLREFHRVLTRDGSLYLHLDYREAHYCKVLLDSIFGRACFLNEIIWAYDYGARATRKWPTKHDNILVYVKDPDSYYFNLEASDRIPYMAPGLVGPDKAARGKTPTDTWWMTIVPTNGRERTGYPTQKPVALLKRIVAVSSRPGALVADFFAGSGTTGEAALSQGRRVLLVDHNPVALDVMAKRLSPLGSIDWLNFDPQATAATQEYLAIGDAHE